MVSLFILRRFYFCKSAFCGLLFCLLTESLAMSWCSRIAWQKKIFLINQCKNCTMHLKQNKYKDTSVSKILVVAVQALTVNGLLKLLWTKLQMSEMRILGFCPSFAYWLLCNLLVLLCFLVHACTKDHIFLPDMGWGERSFKQLLCL